MLNFTTNSAAVLRQQMYESNHEMIHMLAQQMAKIFNPLIQNTTQINQRIAMQMMRISNFFEVPYAPRQLRKERLLENQGAVSLMSALEGVNEELGRFSGFSTVY